MKNKKQLRKALPTSVILKWVALTVLGTLLWWYGVALSAFAGNTHSYNNRFTEVAVGQHLFYLIWNNVEVLKGYGLVGIFCTAMVFPIVLVWSKWKHFGRRGIIWRSLLLSWAFYGYFIFRLMLHKPYFGDFSYFDQTWSMVGQWFGGAIQYALSFAVLNVFPVAAILFSCVYYLLLGVKWCTRRSRLTQWVSAASVVAVAAMVGLSFASANPDDSANSELKESVKKKKNILILASDSLRGDRLGINGYSRNTSPAIDRLAREGANFSRAFTITGSTLESLTTMFSAQYPHTHGVQHMFPNRAKVEQVNRDVPGLATVLNEAGYDTSVIGDWCACGFNELPMGFKDIVVSDFDNFKVYMSEVVYLHHEILPLFFDNRIGHWLFPKLKSFANYMTPNVVTDQIINRLKEREKDDQPFLMLGYYSCTHLPYRAPREYTELWADPKYDGEHKHMLALNVDEFIGSVDIGKKWEAMPKHEVAQINAVYDGCVRMFDDCVGRILEYLDQSGLKEDTIVVITGDHGDDLFEPNVTFGHGLSFNGGDQSNHIPLIIRAPDMKEKGLVIEKLARSIDIAPTLLELSENNPAPSFEGTSLVPYLKDPSADLKLAWFGESSYLFFRRHIPGEEPLYIPAMDETTFIDPDFNFHFVLKEKYEEDVLKTKEHCVRTERFKLVHTPGKYGPIYRLYDLVNDKHCEKDIKVLYPEVFEKMKKALYSWRDEKKEIRIDGIFGELNEFDIEPSTAHVSN